MNYRGATTPIDSRTRITPSSRIPRDARSVRLVVLLVLGGMAALLLRSGSALADNGSAEAGQAKAVTCAACHGADGNSPNPEWPSLAGQHASYIEKSLRDYKAGSRSDVLMTSQAQLLSDQDISDLAAWYSSQKVTPKAADASLIATGERLYRGGSKENGTAACIACHGPTGQGNMPAAWPAIAGQHATYTAKQLRAYRGKERTSDGDTQIMRNVAASLDDDDIQALASYIQGLR